jgi:hypothetical protein
LELDPEEEKRTGFKGILLGHASIVHHLRSFGSQAKKISDMPSWPKSLGFQIISQTRYPTSDLKSQKSHFGYRKSEIRNFGIRAMRQRLRLVMFGLFG